MRLFAAVAFDGKEKDIIHAFCNSLRESGVDGHFTARDNLHLTLKFMGDVQPCKIDGIKAALDCAASGFAPFEAACQGCGFFASRGEKTVWLGVDGKMLSQLAAAVDNALEPLGFERELKPFKPHITLSRRALCDGGLLSGAAAPQLDLSVAGITLYESRRDAGRLWYKPLYFSQFKK